MLLVFSVIIIFVTTLLWLGGTLKSKTPGDATPENNYTVTPKITSTPTPTPFTPTPTPFTPTPTPFTPTPTPFTPTPTPIPCDGDWNNPLEWSTDTPCNADCDSLTGTKVMRKRTLFHPVRILLVLINTVTQNSKRLIVMWMRIIVRVKANGVISRYIFRVTHLVQIRTARNRC